MRRKEKEITDSGIIREILAKSEICRIAMHDGDFPYLLPFNYGYRDNTIYIHSAPEGKKIELLKKNNKVCFEIEQAAETVKHDVPCKWATRYRSVIGYGEVEIITGHEQKKKGLDIIMSQYGHDTHSGYSEKEVERMVILKLKITRMTGKQSGNRDDR